MRLSHGTTRSIGEVLAVLKQEFDDITISKIRFLESEGLVTPERTPSGYRKFTDEDVTRLRYILRQQRDHFLPLKVIKERLDHQAEVAESADSPGDHRAAGTVARSEDTATPAPTGPLSRDQLIAASGLTESRLRDLEQYGLLRGEKTSTGTWYDGEALGIARIAARFLHFGVEPRHLRVFRTAADREADLYKQLIPPAGSARTTQAQTENRARLEELTTLGAALRDVLLLQALEGH